MVYWLFDRIKSICIYVFVDTCFIGLTEHLKCIIIYFLIASYFIWNFSILSGIHIWKENGVQVIAQRFVLPHVYGSNPIFPLPSIYLY